MKVGVLALFCPVILPRLDLCDGTGKGLSPRAPRRVAMTRFIVHSAETAPAGSRPLLEGIGRTFGFVPNLFGVFAESPAALQGALSIYEAFAKSSLSPVE